MGRSTIENSVGYRGTFRDSERAALELLALEGSVAGANYCHLGLNRAILNETLRRLRRNRKEQTVLANVICATRFEFFDEEVGIFPVRCPNGCGEIDSLDHLLDCYRVGPVDPECPFDEKVSFLQIMAIRTAKNCPALPEPAPILSQINPITQDEISLDAMTSSHSASAGDWELVFEHMLSEAERNPALSASDLEP